MGDAISSARPLAYTGASPKCLFPRLSPQAAAGVQGEAFAPPEAASVMTEWMSASTKARRGIYQGTASLGAKPLGDAVTPPPARWRSASTGPKTMRPAASAPVGSSGPAASRQPAAARPAPHAAFPTWSQVVEACTEWCGGFAL